jgi:hypothetical protein
MVVFSPIKRTTKLIKCRYSNRLPSLKLVVGILLQGTHRTPINYAASAKSSYAILSFAFTKLTNNAVIRQFSTHLSLPVDPNSPPYEYMGFGGGGENCTPVQFSIQFVSSNCIIFIPHG